MVGLSCCTRDQFRSPRVSKHFKRFTHSGVTNFASVWYYCSAKHGGATISLNKAHAADKAGVSTAAAIPIPSASTPAEVRALRSLDHLPPFSPILNRLLATLADDDIPFSRVAALIEKDTVLAGNVLRVVNSPLYACRGTVNSVAHAIAIMGLMKLRNTALGLSVTRMWRSIRCPAGWSMAQFNLHSIATGVLADQIAQNVPVDYPEGAFVAGLFHDMGKLLLAVSSPREWERFAAVPPAVPTNGEPLERSVFGVTHADLSALALERWHLPRPIQMAVAFHHDPASAPGSDTPGLRTLSDVVAVADAVTNSMGIAVNHGGSAEGRRAPDPELFAPVGLSERADSVIAAFSAEFETVRSLF